MSLALVAPNGDMVYFDAVLNWNRSSQSQVTQFPTEAGSVIADHVVNQNRKCTLNGVISDADFNLTRPAFTASDLQQNGITPKPFVNNSPVGDTIRITPGTDSSWSQFLPETLAQWTDSDRPQVEVQSRVYARLAREIAEDIQALQRNREQVTILDFSTAGLIQQVHKGLIITSLEFPENAETGDGVYLNITFEQIQVTATVLEETPRNVAEAVKNQTAKRKELGSKNAKGERTVDSEGLDPNKETELAKIRNRDL
ncbi:phage baseplate protein [Pseudomonas aeruginosa]|uniref:phage baseplate protein n=1 Tax=Pseudomonas aeruginosa TaxID=287 RepID=UPI0027D9B5F3|nr:hypothetical protein [Pseudomonas aeruginosa]WME47966.1 hypothetical protein RBH03_02330 [Pseudomonas aeruginosa]